jgi:hypothetical protein
VGVVEDVIDMTDFKCTKCEEHFDRIGIFAAHFRHKHTDYDFLSRNKAIVLRGVKGITPFAKKLMIREYARSEVDKLVQANVTIIKEREGIV